MDQLASQSPPAVEDRVAVSGVVHVVGASGRSGTALVRALLAEGSSVVPVVRSVARWQAAGIPIPSAIADMHDPASLRAALAGATCVVSCAHARHAGAILAAAPPDAKFVFLGSTRKFTRWPDEHGSGVLAGEQAFLASGRRGVMLHPTMIYGAQGENNVQRLAALLRRLPVVPLPGGGRSLVQPIHQDDVTRAVLTAIKTDWRGPTTLVIAGPSPLSYADFVHAVARAAGMRRRMILPVPARLLISGAPVTRALPFLPTILADEMRRLLEDKAFDISPMIATLGVRPIQLEAGLAATFRPAS